MIYLKRAIENLTGGQKSSPLRTLDIFVLGLSPQAQLLHLLGSIARA